MTVIHGTISYNGNEVTWKPEPDHKISGVLIQGVLPKPNAAPVNDRAWLDKTLREISAGIQATPAAVVPPAVPPLLTVGGVMTQGGSDRVVVTLSGPAANQSLLFQLSADDAANLADLLRVAARTIHER